MDKTLSVIIMAGGLGKRMKSEIPKVLHKVGDIPMLVRVIQQVQKLDIENIYIIVGKYKSIIEKTLEEYNINDVIYINQEIPQGTGHAIQCAVEDLENDDCDNVLILNGDNPLIQSETLNKMLKDVDKCKIMTALLEDQRGCGRVVINEISKEFEKIVEEKDCNSEELKLKRINAGIYIFDRNVLLNNIMKLNNNNAQNEYYLTDVIEIIKNNKNCNIQMYQQPPHKNYELLGANDVQQLVQLNNIFIQKNFI
jgi:UDP-N-acetylglucosamine diphosphorylase/glucosamine-1-phosphate N-acetyltransferase